MMITQRVSVALIATIASVGLLSACESTYSFKQSKVEKVIASGYEEQDPGSKVASVDCPKKMEGKKGAKWVCKIALEDGSTGEITVVAGDNGDMRWDVTKDTTK
ncbi:MAG: DUF4333 domain-containing protein [Aeromicrobium sp.]